MDDNEEEEARAMVWERQKAEGSRGGEQSGGMAVAKGSHGKGMAVAEEVVVPYGGKGERGHEVETVAGWNGGKGERGHEVETMAGWRRDGDTKMRGREERVRRP
jgi:hypothetical protein